MSLSQVGPGQLQQVQSRLLCPLEGWDRRPVCSARPGQLWQLPWLSVGAPGPWREQGRPTRALGGAGSAREERMTARPSLFLGLRLTWKLASLRGRGKYDSTPARG